MFLLVALAVLVLVTVYWAYFQTWSNRGYSRIQMVVLLLMLATLVFAHRTDRELLRGNVPTLVAIASDVSLSMGTLPDPRTDVGVGTRLQRAQNTLTELLGELDASTLPVMVGITAFTSKSETILAWDDNLPQVTEAVDYVLATGLLTEPGSDLGAALDGAIPLFEILPEAYRHQEQNLFLIVVSDGEQTVDEANIAQALASLRELGVRIVSLHVGLPDTQEGLPVYDDDGNFIGFEEVGGQIYSVPDPEIMSLIAGSDANQGLYAKAEDADSADRIMDFIGVPLSNATSGPLYLVIVLIMWGLTTAGLLRLAD
jgi:hypothetical protein